VAARGLYGPLHGLVGLGLARSMRRGFLEFACRMATGILPRISRARATGAPAWSCRSPNRRPPASACPCLLSGRMVAGGTTHARPCIHAYQRNASSTSPYNATRLSNRCVAGRGARIAVTDQREYRSANVDTSFQMGIQKDRLRWVKTTSRLAFVLCPPLLKRYRAEHHGLAVGPRGRNGPSKRSWNRAPSSQHRRHPFG